LLFSNPHEVPYRDESSYKLSLKMEFKTEKAPSNDKVDMVYTKKRSNGPLLYLNASLELLTLLENDYRIKVINSKKVVIKSARLKSPTTILFDLGFAEYMKSEKSSNTFTIQFIDKKRNVVSHIFLEIKKDGDFMVNGKRFGKV